MDPVTLTVVGWLVQPAAGALFAVAQEYLLQRLGLGPSRSATSHIKPLLDAYLRHLTTRLDEDRVAKLYGALATLKDAPKSVAMQELLIEALGSFHEVAQIPQQGMTRGRPNAELRCMAFIGMVASYKLLHDQPELIAEKMVEAVRADADTAKQWLGENLVREIISRFPLPGIVCPRCGFQNQAGSRFCNRDRYPLDSGQKPSFPPSSRTSTLLLRRPFGILGGGPVFKIFLDGQQRGTIHAGESCALEIQAGHHALYLSTFWYSSSSLSLDIVPGEKAIFLCLWMGMGNAILLWKQ